MTRHYVLIDFAARVVAGELRAGSDAAEARWVPFSALDDYALWSETRRIIEDSRRAASETRLTQSGQIRARDCRARTAPEPLTSTPKTWLIVRITPVSMWP